MSELRRILSVALFVTVAGAQGCSTVIEREGDSPAGDGLDDHLEQGSGGAGHASDVDVGETPADGAVDERFSFCSPPPARPAGLREGTVPTGDLDEEHARAIFSRAAHEVGHLTSALIAHAAGSAGEESDLFLVEGDTISSDRDGEALRGTLTRDPDTGVGCAAIVFGSWTGGHGGWGKSALDGTLLMLLDGDEVESRGQLGLVEAGPLEGAPSVEVRVDYVDEVVSGDVGGFAF